MPMRATMLALGAMAAPSCAVVLYPDLAEPNPPLWPDSVKVFSENDTGIDATIAAAYALNGGHEPANHGQFSPSRFAFLFKPGTYDVDCPVGYYTQVLGLGASPSDVTFTSPKGVYSEEQDYSIGGALSTFWRSAENFRTSASFDWQVGKGMMWAVSQAAPLRRVQVDNDLSLFEYQPPITAAGEASGGFMANVKVGAAVRTGRVVHEELPTLVPRRSTDRTTTLRAVAPGSQQQWFARDSTVASWDGGVWNMVFSGVEGAPPSHCGNEGRRGGGRGAAPAPHAAAPITAVDITPAIAEKPYITIGADGRYSLQLPPLKKGSRGADFGGTAAGGKSVDFEDVYVTAPGDTAAVINAKLAAGRHVVFTPAVYELDEPLAVKTAGQVVLGLGLATLVSSAGNALIKVGDVDGVRVAGLLLQAGPLPARADGRNATSAPTLLEWGTGAYGGSAEAPGLLHDVFARVGGPDGTASDPVAAATMVHIRSGHVIGDNLWLWRADHAAGGPVSFESNPCDHGLIVDGDDVTM
jgi:hypothetical protein